MDANRIEYLTLTYQLFMRIRKGLDDLCVAFSNYIKVRQTKLSCCKTRPADRFPPKLSYGYQTFSQDDEISCVISRTFHGRERTTAVSNFLILYMLKSTKNKNYSRFNVISTRKVSKRIQRRKYRKYLLRPSIYRSRLLRSGC